MSDFSEEEINARRNSSLIKETTQTQPKDALPPIPDIDLPTIMGDGPNGPHFVYIPVLDENGKPGKIYKLRLSAFKLRDLPLANRAFNALPLMLQTLIYAWSRMKIGSENLDIQEGINFMKAVSHASGSIAGNDVTADTMKVAAITGIGGMEENEVESLMDFIFCSLSRYNPNIDREELLDNIDITAACRIAGAVLAVNPGFSDVFFVPSVTQDTE